MPKIDTEIAKLEKHVESLIGSYVDPKEAFLGPDGEYWNPVSGDLGGSGYGLQEEPPYRTIPELRDMRVIGKWFDRHNGYAKNGIENRISYIVGEGHTYAAELRDRNEKDDGPVKRVSAFLETWQKKNKWSKRQKESQKRADRDGELFFRYFYPDDGYLLVRYVEPAAVTTPPQDEIVFETGDFDYSFGIKTPADDIETPVAYWIQSVDGVGAWVDAEHVQHRKFNVDSSLKRGVPLFWGVRHSLDRCLTILKNNSLAMKIQTAIAMIRKHKSSKEATQAFVSAKANLALSKTNPGKTENVFKYPAGSIVDASANMDYEFPSIGADPAKAVKALQAELRHVAVSVGMPEYMFTGDASNNNRASSDTAETPAMKRFTRDQDDTIVDDLEVIDAALEFAVDAGRLSADDVAAVRITATAPEVQPRDKKVEAEIRQSDLNAGILSPQTATAQIGEVYDVEQTNIQTHVEKTGGVAGLTEAEPF